MSAALPLQAAQDYPLLNLFWTMLWLFVWILWIFLLIRILIDVFRSDDLGGWGKALWTIFIIVVPLIGVLVYVSSRGTGVVRDHVIAALSMWLPVSRSTPRAGTLSSCGRGGHQAGAGG